MKKKQYGPEQKYVISTFQNSFSGLKEQKQKIVLYGTGVNTEAVLYGTEGFCIAGLMDQAATGQMVYGKKVLSDREVIKMHPVIVIIARQSVVSIIYRRIQYLSLKHGILIYDLAGTLLGRKNLEYNNQNLSYWNVTEWELIKKIKEHEIITFDIFDTLLMRRTLLPTDVFELVEKELAHENCAYPFSRMRLAAEQALDDCPDLDRIYEKMKEIYQLEDAVAEKMKKTEYQTDASMLIRREKMYRIFQTAVSEKKDVYLLSDMYYPKEYLEELLKKHGIEGYKKLYVSCDVKKEKSDGSLYQFFLSQAGPGRAMHIGDNRRADIEMAAANGMNAFWIFSAYELLMASSLQNVLADADTLRKRCMLGLIVSRVFNNPFVLGSTKGILQIDEIQDAGYCFIAPILTEFTKWFASKIREYEIEQILFPSRDGYLMKMLYEVLTDQKVETIYFRTSRRSASVAGICGRSDIRQNADRGYHGTYGNFLKTRFGVDMKAEDTRKDRFVNTAQKESMEALLLDYEAAILKNAREERERYLQYLKNSGLFKEKRQALFDFVAGGTVQYNLTRLLGRKVPGFYFATMNLPNHFYEEETSDIEAAYGNIRSYNSRYQIGRYYLLMETVLSEGVGTFRCIGSDGMELFEPEDEKNGRAQIEKMQQAVLDYAADEKDYFFCMAGSEPELEFADMLFGMLFGERVRVSERIKEVFVNDDRYDGVESSPLWEVTGR